MKDYRVDIFNGAEPHESYYFDTETDAMNFLLKTQIKRGQKAFLLKSIYTDTEGNKNFDVVADLTDFC